MELIDSAVTFERIERQGLPLLRLTFTDQYEPFMVWLKPGQIPEFRDLLRTLGKYDYEGFWADDQIFVAVKRNCIHLVRQHGRRRIERDYKLTKANANQLAKMLPSI